MMGEKPEWLQDHHYVLEPVGGTAQYFKLGQKDTRSPEKPAQKAVAILHDVTIALSEVLSEQSPPFNSKFYLLWVWSNSRISFSTLIQLEVLLLLLRAACISFELFPVLPQFACG